MSFCRICAKRTTAVQIADIDAKRGGAMALDYDTCKKKPWWRQMTAMATAWHEAP